MIWRIYSFLPYGAFFQLGLWRAINSTACFQPIAHSLRYGFSRFLKFCFFSFLYGLIPERLSEVGFIYMLGTDNEILVVLQE